MSKTACHPPLPRCHVTWDASHSVICSWFHLKQQGEKGVSYGRGPFCVISRFFFFFFLNINKSLCSVKTHRSWRKNHFHFQTQRLFYYSGVRRGAGAAEQAASFTDPLINWGVRRFKRRPLGNICESGIHVIKICLDYEREEKKKFGCVHSELKWQM